MTEIPADLKNVHEQVQQGQTPKVTVRKLLEWFSSERRGSRVVSNIHAALRELSMGTRPNFEDAWIDGEVTFFSTIEVPRPQTAPPPAGEQPQHPDGDALPTSLLTEPLPPAEMAPGEPSPTPSAQFSEPPPQQAPNVRHDPVFSLGKLSAAHRKPERVSPTDPISRAITVMMLHDFSQLPVASTDYRLDGAVSWKSIAQAYALKKEPSLVKDCMGFAPVYSPGDSVFDALEEMSLYGFVLVRARGELQGIITLVDVAAEFQGSFEPFVLIGEIERQLRKLLEARVPIELIRDICENSQTKTIQTVNDLSFGQYKRLLEHEEVWSRCGLPVDRLKTVERMEKIREIRNDLMHYLSEGVGEKNLNLIRKMAVFLREVLR